MKKKGVDKKVPNTEKSIYKIIIIGLIFIPVLLYIMWGARGY